MQVTHVFYSCYFLHVQYLHYKQIYLWRKLQCVFFCSMYMYFWYCFNKYLRGLKIFFCVELNFKSALNLFGLWPDREG